MSGWTKRVRRRAFCREAAALLPVTLALAAVPVAEAAPAVPGARRSTPALLDEAVARGDLDRSTADEHLVEVFVGPGRSDKVPAGCPERRPHGRGPCRSAHHQPVPADYDGNADAERAVFNGGAWYVEGQPPAFFGLPGDVPVPGDYDGDGDADRAVYRPLVGAGTSRASRRSSWAWPTTSRCPVTTTATGTPTAPSTGPAGRGTSRARPRCSWAGRDTSPCPATTTATAPPTGRCSRTEPGTSRTSRRRSSAWPVTSQPGDYDGDGDTDRAVFDGNGWHVQGQPTVFLGLSGDAPLVLPSAILRIVLEGNGRQV